GIESLIMMNMSADMVKKWRESENATGDGPETHFVIGDEEFLPIKASSQDLIMSCLGLHWTNDLPGAMIQCRLALQPDGLFLAAILCGETLKIACTVSQMEREGGISPRMSPLAQVWLFSLELVEHLRAVGETNALFQRNPPFVIPLLLDKLSSSLPLAKVSSSTF
ncbi:hypothetical protein ACJX0J_032025, partial [Zea mays]